jgi:hypothetical protein
LAVDGLPGMSLWAFMVGVIVGVMVGVIVAFIRVFF